MAVNMYSAKFSSLSNLSNRKLPNKQYPALSTHFTKPLPRFSSKHNRISAVTDHSNIFDDSSEESLNLHDIRQSLIRQEDSIIFALLERSIFCHNSNTYVNDFFEIGEFHGSLVKYMVQETEALHAKMGRYKSPDEYPFFPGHLPKPIMTPMDYPDLHPVADSININNEIWGNYLDKLLPDLWNKDKEDDGNYGSTAVCDTICLQSQSKRIHSGKFVAEAKYKASPEIYEPAIKAQDKKKLWNLLTNESVEESVKERVRIKAKIFGLDLNVGGSSKSDFKIDPKVIAELYGKWIIPLTKEVEVQYLLRRLD